MGGGQRIIILGAASALAEATARIWAEQGARFVLVGRDRGRLVAIAADLAARGAAEAAAVVLDCSKCNAMAELEDMVAALGGLDVLMLAYGTMAEQRYLESDPEAAGRLIETDFSSPASWCLAAGVILERQRSGVLLVIGSVAGDRGRRSNYLYGACKGGLAHLVEGIAHKLARSGARAVIVKPGLVDTPMTARIEKRGLLWVKPATVARVIAKAAEGGGPIIYAPAYWRAIMLVVRQLPTAVFNRLDI